MRVTCSKCDAPLDGANGSYCKACFNAYSRERTAAGRRKPTTSTRDTCAKCGMTPKDGSHYSYCKECMAAYMRDTDPEHRLTRNRVQNQRNRCLQKRAPWVEYVEPLVVLERDDGVCGVCGCDVDPFDFELDHVIPLARGGEHSYYNVQIVHPICNRRKGLKVAA